jgi:hypothetical protein
VIADNKIAENTCWDREMLAIELGELIDLLPTEGLFWEDPCACGKVKSPREERLTPGHHRHIC